MRGRAKFSRAEVQEIGAILVRIRNGDRNTQKRLRNRLRKSYGFYITDFDETRRGFTRNDLEMLVSSGVIEVVDEW